ncbi:hypothetical protein LCGC14_0971830 [marine sediment metagenome]|uniref:Methyltransferase type 11 domain-containing protein n=1 Tax=marine sediment metagenome TaxID=412755 RepID=A0A0F9RHV2_9ZZZZ
MIKIEKYRKKKHKISRKDVKILDYGCGKGESVTWFKERGYNNTYGVDINPIVIRNGLTLLSEKGYSRKSLELLDKNGKTSFPENYFDFVFSNQVFEHIEDINKVINEIFRITKENGEGFHLFPAKWGPLEGHLFMPFIHWLPKNHFRKFLIFFFVSIGLEPRYPRWKETINENKKKRTEIYYNYSVNKTFYRDSSELEGVFRKFNFHVSLYLFKKNINIRELIRRFVLSNNVLLTQAKKSSNSSMRYFDEVKK